jgi:pimeloyl-ACP methyl ester carboxylesterase
MPAMVAELEEGDPTYWASEGERERWLASDAKAIAAALEGWWPEALSPEQLSTITVPALVYCGSDDNPDPKQRAAEAMPNATYVALDGLNHASAINLSERVLPHVKAFLAQVEEAAQGTP